MRCSKCPNLIPKSAETQRWEETEEDDGKDGYEEEGGVGQKQ